MDHFPAVSEGKGRRKPRAGRVPPQQTEKELEEERQRKAERNRAVFLTWLERKQEDEKRRRAEQREAARLEEERLEQRWRVNKVAYDTWLKRKKMDDEFWKKKRAKEREIARLRMMEVRDRTRRAGEAYASWKQRKDTDLKTEKELACHYQRALTPPSREPTPTLPGYCSVWSCDDHMAKFFVNKVRRAGSFDLSDIHTFEEHEHHQTITNSYLSATT